MAYDVTSWFIDQTLELAPNNIVRKLIIGSSDYSERVTQWPSFKKSWNDIRPVSLTVTLANDDKALNFLRDDKTVLVSSATIQFGYTHPDSGDETIDLFTGTTDKVKYKSGAVEITVTDKFKRLTERIVGNDDNPVTYSGSNYLPSDIAWYLVTSYGGYSTVKSSSNPDIDYEAWLTWSNAFSLDATYANASFDGQKVSECIRKIGRMTRSAIFIKEDKISFHRFSAADSNQTSLGSGSILDMDLLFSDEDMVNKQYVYADYSVDSEYYQTVVFDASTSSINSYGLREEKEEDSNVWYVGSGPAINLAQRILSTDKVPFDKISINTTLVGITRLVGETIIVFDAFHGLDSGYRIMEQKIDVNKGIVSFEADKSQFLNPFILDTSTLNGPDALT